MLFILCYSSNAQDDAINYVVLKVSVDAAIFSKSGNGGHLKTTYYSRPIKFHSSKYTLMDAKKAFYKETKIKERFGTTKGSFFKKGVFEDIVIVSHTHDYDDLKDELKAEKDYKSSKFKKFNISSTDLKKAAQDR